jgi:hypothetical protein
VDTNKPIWRNNISNKRGHLYKWNAMELLVVEDNNNKVFNVNVNSFGKPHNNANSIFSYSFRRTKSRKRPYWARKESKNKNYEVFFFVWIEENFLYRKQYVEHDYMIGVHVVNKKHYVV